PADLTELKAIILEFRKHADRPRELARLIRRFDVILCDLSGNEALKFVSQVMAEIIDAQIESIPERAQDLPRENAADIAPSQERMRDILDALEQQDGIRAEKLLRTRLEELVLHHKRVVDHSHRLKIIS
ncbi:MAG: FCD domain-containing protein, partial [Sphingobium sp.]